MQVETDEPCVHRKVGGSSVTWETGKLPCYPRPETKHQARDQGSDDTNVRETQVKKSNYGVNIPYVRFS